MNPKNHEPQKFQGPRAELSPLSNGDVASCTSSSEKPCNNILLVVKGRFLRKHLETRLGKEIREVSWVVSPLLVLMALTIIYLPSQVRSASELPIHLRCARSQDTSEIATILLISDHQSYTCGRRPIIGSFDTFPQ